MARAEFALIIVDAPLHAFFRSPTVVSQLASSIPANQQLASS
jgi:hypothetical protein